MDYEILTMSKRFVFTLFPAACQYYMGKYILFASNKKKANNERAF